MPQAGSGPRKGKLAPFLPIHAHNVPSSIHDQVPTPTQVYGIVGS